METAPPGEDPGAAASHAAGGHNASFAANADAGLCAHNASFAATAGAGPCAHHAEPSQTSKHNSCAARR